MSLEDQKRWSVIKAMIPTAKNKVIEFKGNEALFEVEKEKLHLSDASLLGSFFKHVGGLTIDNHLVTILGSNEDEPALNVFYLNERFHQSSIANAEKFLLLGYDWTGNLFAVNTASDSADIGNVCYYSEEDREWMDLEFGIDRFFNWLMSDNVQGFYEDYPILTEKPVKVGDVYMSKKPLMEIEDDDKVACHWISIIERLI